jgi:hypothetical protein
MMRNNATQSVSQRLRVITNTGMDSLASDKKSLQCLCKHVLLILLASIFAHNLPLALQTANCCAFHSSNHVCYNILRPRLDW